MRRIWSIAAAGFLFFSGKAWGLDAEGLWRNWQDMAEIAQSELMAVEEARKDGSLHLRGVSSFYQGAEGGSIRLDLGEIGLRSLADDQVEIILPAAMQLHIYRDIGGQDQLVMRLELRQKGGRLRAKAGTNLTAYALSFPQISVVLNEAPDLEGIGAEWEFESFFKNISGEVEFGFAEDGAFLGAVDLGFAAGDLRLYAAKGAKDSPGRGIFDGTLDLGAGELHATFGAQATGGDGATPASPADRLDVSLSKIDLGFDLHGDGQSLRFAGQSAGIELSGAYNLARLTLGLGLVDVLTRLDLTDFGARRYSGQVGLSVGAAQLDFDLPLRFADRAQSADLSLRLEEVAPTKNLWDVVDPRGILTRKAGHLSLQTSGQVRLARDLFPIGLDGPVLWRDVQLEEVVLHALNLGLEGAQLSGTGQLRNDHNVVDLAQFLPLMRGNLDFIVTGGNAVLEKLAGLGFIKPEDLMAARIAFAMFTTAGDTQTQRRSHIEFRESGIYVNGRKLP